MHRWPLLMVVVGAFWARLINFALAGMMLAGE